MLQTQEYIVLIIIYNCMSIKKAEKRKERKYPCIAFVIFNFLFTILVFFISSRWFDLPSGVISLLQYYDPTHLLCTVIAKYIIFLYVISQTQLHTCILFYIIALQIREKRRGNMHFYCNTLFVFLMCMQVFIWVYLLLSWRIWDIVLWIPILFPFLWGLFLLLFGCVCETWLNYFNEVCFLPLCGINSWKALPRRAHGHVGMTVVLTGLSLTVFSLVSVKLSALLDITSNC